MKVRSRFDKIKVINIYSKYKYKSESKTTLRSLPFGLFHVGHFWPVSHSLQSWSQHYRFPSIIHYLWSGLEMVEVVEVLGVVEVVNIW